MKIYLLCLFPEEIRQYFLKGIFKKAVDAGLVDIQFVDVREFALDKHQRVDDYPFGHRKGMLLKADVLARAIRSIDQYEEYRLLYTCPKGRRLAHGRVVDYSQAKGLIIICGYYEGIDERLFELFDIERVSIGDLVLSSGELPALCIAESVIRLIPGVVGNSDCVEEDSIVSGLLSPPEYTAPREFEGQHVPDVLLSGHHARIRDWRRKCALRETLLSRPDLLSTARIDDHDQKLLGEIIKEECQ